MTEAEQCRALLSALSAIADRSKTDYLAAQKAARALEKRIASLSGPRDTATETLAEAKSQTLHREWQHQEVRKLNASLALARAAEEKARQEAAIHTARREAMAAILDDMLEGAAKDAEARALDARLFDTLSRQTS